MSRPATPPEERFWPRVDVGSGGGCWRWCGGRGTHGYGVLAEGATGQHLAHRFVYELCVGPIPDGLTIDHLCRDGMCVNPLHMILTTNVANVMDGVSPAAVNARKTHCLRGHPLSGANLQVNPRGERICRTCRREAMRRARAEGRAA